MTVLEWIRRPPKRRSPKTLDEEIEKWRIIRALAPPAGLGEIPVQRLREYARRMRRRRPIKVQQIAEPRRTLEIAALLSVLATRQSDTVLKLIEMRIADIWTDAYAQAQPVPLQNLPAEAAIVLAQVVNDPSLSDSAFRDRAERCSHRGCRRIDPGAKAGPGRCVSFSPKAADGCVRSCGI